MKNQSTSHVHGADYENVDQNYFGDRQLNQGTVGWFLLAVLGVSAVIAGHFAAWNYGIGLAGWGGMVISLLLMGGMYFCLMFSMAELASVIPTAGGGYGFARRAFGPFAGYVTGMAIIFEYIGCTGVIAIFISAYTEALLGIGGLPVYIALYCVFISIHVYGVGEALKVLLVLASLAAVGLIAFILSMLPHFDAGNLFDIATSTSAAGASKLLPFGYLGIWAALPFGMAMFLAVEAVPLMSEEAREPEKNVPRGMIAAIATLMTFAIFILFSGPAGSSAALISTGDDPLVTALNAAYGQGQLTTILVNVAALLGLTASFFSVIFAYSRQIFSLSRAGYLPRFLSLTNGRKTPYLAIILPGILSFGLTLTGAADQLIVVLVFSATLSYIIMMTAHLKLRSAEPDLHRPYRTPGGRLTSAAALFLAILAFIACFLGNEPKWSIATAALLGVCVLYFLFYSRHHLIAQAPEEEFEMLQIAETELAN